MEKRRNTLGNRLEVRLRNEPRVLAMLCGARGRKWERQAELDLCTWQMATNVWSILNMFKDLKETMATEL